MKYLYFDTNLMDEKYILAFGKKQKQKNKKQTHYLFRLKVTHTH